MTRHDDAESLSRARTHLGQSHLFFRAIHASQFELVRIVQAISPSESDSTVRRFLNFRPTRFARTGLLHVELASEARGVGPICGLSITEPQKVQCPESLMEIEVFSWEGFPPFPKPSS